MGESKSESNGKEESRRATPVQQTRHVIAAVENDEVAIVQANKDGHDCYEGGCEAFRVKVGTWRDSIQASWAAVHMIGREDLRVQPTDDVAIRLETIRRRATVRERDSIDDSEVDGKDRCGDAEL